MAGSAVRTRTVMAAQIRTPCPCDYGPRLLAKYLDAFCGQITRARGFGLIPGPDRGRRWSAAAAEDIRARWPQVEAETRRRWETRGG